MLGYASPSPVAPRRFSPTSIALIVGGHVVLLALVASARMEAIPKSLFPPTILVPIAKPAPPPPPPPPTADPKPHTLQPSARPTATHPIVDELPPMGTVVGPHEVKVPTDPFPGGSIAIDPVPPHAVVHRAAALLTPESELRPPYPLDKQRLGEEATLALRLTIAADGRVTSVDPVGAADPSFLAAARRYIIGHWRYRPAADDGSAVATVLTVRLSFRLDDAE